MKIALSLFYILLHLAVSMSLVHLSHLLG
jgi:hypothetical protein